MDRRRFVVLTASALAAPLARAQQAKRPYRVGWPMLAPLATVGYLRNALEEGLRAEGLVPGKDVLIDYRSADAKLERYEDVVREVLKNRPDVIVTGVNQNTLPVKAATQTIPIVMMVGTNVVKVGIVPNLARPGGNVTGMTWDAGSEMSAKRLELLKAAAPGIRRLAIVLDPPFNEEFREADETTAKALGWSVVSRESEDDFEAMFAHLARERVDALTAHVTGRIYGRRAEFIALAAKHRILSAFPVDEFVTAGGFLSYGPDLADLYRRGAVYVSKILRGAKPGDLPVQQPTKIDFVINLKTAKALGLDIPRPLLLRADRIIE